MPETSKCRFIKHVAEFVPWEFSKFIPSDTRGIYALLDKHGLRFDVVYVGKTNYGMFSRLGRHRRDWLKSKWTHFTIFEVHDNITDKEIGELEGLFRHMYRKDSKTNRHNSQLRHMPFQDPSIQLPEKKQRSKSAWKSAWSK
jgi:hypothetical protein